MLSSRIRTRAGTVVLAMALTAGATAGDGVPAAEADTANSGAATKDLWSCASLAHAVAGGALARVEEAVGSPSAIRTTAANLRSAPKATIADLLGDEIDPFADPVRARLIGIAVDRALTDGDDGMSPERLAAELLDIALWQIVWFSVGTLSTASSLPPGHPCKEVADRVDDLGRQSMDLLGKWDDCVSPPPPPPSTPGPNSAQSEDGTGGGAGEGGGDGTEQSNPCDDIWNDMLGVDQLYQLALGELLQCLDAHRAGG